MDVRRPLQLLAHPLDAEILMVLARADKAFSGREIERAVGEGAHGSFVKALRRLADGGIVESERAGRAIMYRLNREHLAAPAIAELADLRGALLTRLRQEVDAWSPPALSVILFGSAARGDAGRASDIDILVIRPAGVDPDDGVWREQLMSLEANTTAWTGNDTRVLEWAADELPKAGEEPVIDDALSDGIELGGEPLRKLRRLIARRT